MIKVIQTALLLALVFGFTHQADAALLIEPVLGYNLGAKIESDDGSNKGSGPAFGGRLGYQYLGFQIGADYLNSRLNLDDWNKDLDLTEWAGFVGFEFPILLRVYAGYIFSATGEGKIEGIKAELNNGSGTKVGLGFTPLPFIDINLEMRQATFDEGKIGGVKIDGKTDYRTYMISLSLPFTL
jgi:hypothetical protein